MYAVWLTTPTPSLQACSWNAGGSILKAGAASGARSSATWCAGLGQVDAIVPAKRNWIGRCRWPHSTRSTCGWRAITRASAPLPDRPIWSMWPMSVGNGGWCMISSVGLSRLKERIFSSQARRSSFLRPSGIGEIAGGEHEVGALRQAQDFRDAAGEHRGAVHHAIGKPARRLDVQVADLAGEERAHFTKS